MATQENSLHAFCVQRGDLCISFPHTLASEDEQGHGLAWLLTGREKAVLTSEGIAEPELIQERQHASHQ